MNVSAEERRAAQLAIGDGALDKLPKSQHGDAQSALHEIWQANPVVRGEAELLGEVCGRSSEIIDGRYMLR